MKKLLFSFFLTLSVSLSVVGQITLEETLSVGPGQEGLTSFNTSNSGYKYLSGNNPDSGTDTVTIYNQDWSIRRQVILPVGYYYLNSISDNLFNSDSLIEFVMVKVLSNGSGYEWTGSIINELGQIQFTFPDTIRKGGDNEVINFGSVFKFKYLTNNYKYKIYTLPGTLPCNQCNYSTGLEEPNTGGGIGEMKVYPNPFNNTLQVNYDFPTNQSNPRLVLTDILGRELRERKLTSQTDNVSINTSDLPKGTIIVSLYGGQNMISKKVIKID